VTDDEIAQNDKRAMDILLRQIDWNLLPLLMSLYFFSYLDRTNIGNVLNPCYRCLFGANFVSIHYRKRTTF
jgi:hypothetical protein